MNNYWKQSLVIGGFYWLISLFFKITGIWWVLLLDLGLSLLLLLFLLPMKWLVPIKRVDNCINKHPIISTMLASVGWMPYYTAIIFIIASAAAMFVYYDVASLEKMSGVFIFTGFMVKLEKFTALIVVILTIIMLVGYKKSIAGPLSKCCSCRKEKSEPISEVKKVSASLKETAAKTKKTTPVKKEATTKKAVTAKKVTATKKAKTATAKKAVVTKKENAVKKETPVKKIAAEKKKTDVKAKSKTPVKKKVVKKAAEAKKKSPAKSSKSKK